ncbi:DNA modification methylase, partial [Fusobacterium sp. PH5-7]|nr:DNA modification methylase [Fusobacterium sp. PH5-7]
MIKIMHGNSLEVLKTLEDESIDCVVTSPPYWQIRDYGVSGQIGLESDVNEFLEKLMNIFDEVYRVLKKS